MRLSVVDYPTLSKYCRAFVDGVEVTNDCSEADTVNGYAVVYDRVNGRLVRDDYTDGPKIKTLRGRVEISLKENAPQIIIDAFEDMKEQEATA